MLLAMADDLVDPAAQALARARSVSGSKSRRRTVTPTHYSGAKPDDRDPGALGRIIDDWARSHGYSDRLAVSALLDRWEQIVGSEVAAHVSVGEYRPTDSGGTVILNADSPSWALQMKYLKDTVLARIQEEIGPGLVNQINIVGPKEPARKGGRLRVRHGRRSPRI